MNNEMNFAFIDMGQGDCTIISCPDDSVYIVDCGSSGGLEEGAFTAAKALVRTWANGKSVNMIMTHPDKDHYNQFINLLVMTEPKVKVNVIYFSRAKNDKSPLAYYNETALGRNLSHFGNPLLIEVTLNSTTHSIKRWSNLDYQAAIGPTVIPATGYVLQKGTVMATDWSLTIIAGNVATTSQTPSEQSNVVSLCTVAKFGTEKLVLTGDATSETLAYLQTSQSAQIADASIFQAPHHGSASSTPTVQFMKLVKPESVLVSVGLLNDSFHLPRYSVLKEWESAPNLQDKDLAIDYWKTPDEVTMKLEDLKNILAVTWKSYKVLNNGSGTFFWLSDPKDAGPTKSNTGFYGFTNNGYLLYRVTSTKDIYETGIIGSDYETGFK